MKLKITFHEEGEAIINSFSYKIKLFTCSGEGFDEKRTLVTPQYTENIKKVIYINNSRLKYRTVMSSLFQIIVLCGERLWE